MPDDPMAVAAQIQQSYALNPPLEDMLTVRGKVAIVTGGTSGLGFCIAQRLLQGGAKVVIASRSEEKAAVALKMLEGQDVRFCQTDIRDDAQVEQLVDYAADTFGSADILVTAAGVWSFAHVQDLPEEALVDTVNTNLLGTFRCAKHVSRYMIDHGIAGKIVLIASNSAYITQPLFGGNGHYAASKGGVVALTQELGKELKRYGIQVNCVAPGAMLTPGVMTNGPVPTLPAEKQMELGAEMMVSKMDRMPTADSVAIVAYGLCTRMSDGVTGETVVADDGMMRNIVDHQEAIAAYPPQAQ